MSSRKFILQQTGIIALGEIFCIAIMYGVYAMIGGFDSSVVLGGIAGSLLAIGNFFFMAIAADLAADKAVNQDVKGGKSLIQSSYLMRLVVIALILFACAKSGFFNLIALVIPLLLTRPIITISEFFRKSGESSK